MNRILGLAFLLALNVYATEVDHAKIFIKSVEELEAEKVLNEFLLEFDETTIKKDYKKAVKQNSALKRIDIDLPPRTPDLFESGLFMPYEDDQKIYHDFDRIYYKVKDGNWNLDKKAEATGRSGIVFSKETGYENSSKESEPK